MINIIVNIIIKVDIFMDVIVKIVIIKYQNIYIVINVQKKKNEKENNENIFCTCTKNWCNKNYCECYKNKIRYNNQCRCGNCENYENNSDNNNNSKRYECDKANNIYIIGNKIFIEDITKDRNARKIKIVINDILSSLSDNKITGRKLILMQVSN